MSAPKPAWSGAWLPSRQGGPREDRAIAAPALDLVIFDCDGVLVDSEPLAMRVLLDALALRGLPFDDETGYRHFLGRSLPSLAEYLLTSYGFALDEQTQADMRKELFATYRRALRPTGGIEAVLDRLDMPFCVASSSQPERLRVSLEVTGLLNRFEPHVFSASMVRHGKPAPDLFFYSADRMGAAPSRCLVIEDSPAGIEAAHAAGMAVFAFTGGSHIAPGGLLPAIEAQNPNAIFDDMRQLPEMLAAWQPAKAAAS